MIDMGMVRIHEMRDQKKRIHEMQEREVSHPANKGMGQR
jgi:hypothetical protein